MPALKAIFSADASQLYEVLSHGIPQRLRGLRQELNSVFRSGANKSTIFNLAQEKNAVREYGDWWVSTLRDQSVRAATRSNEARRLLRERAYAAERRAEEAHQRSFSGRVGSFFGGVAGSFIGVGAAVGAIYKLLEFATSSVKVNIQLQQMFNTLKTVSGSAAQATKDMEFLKQASNNLGFSFLESGATFARFSAASTAAGLSSEKTRKVFLGVQEAALVMGMTTDQTASTMLALEQMLSKGTVMSQELRLQLGNAMPGAMNIFARAIGVTVGELYKMVENGLVPAKEAVQLFGLELQKSFTLTPEANKTVREITRMTNAMIKLKEVTGKALAPEVEGSAQNIGFWANLLGSGGDNPMAGKLIKRGLFGFSQNYFSIAKLLGAGSSGNVKIDPKLEAEAKARKIAKIESEQAVLTSKLRSDAAKTARDKDLQKAGEIDKKTADKRREREIGAMPHDEKVAALRKNVKSLEADIADNQLYYTESQLAQRRNDLEDARDDLQREEGKKTSRGSHSGIQQTAAERHGASFGGPVFGLIDINKQILSEHKKTNNLLGRGGRNGGITQYFRGH